MHCIYPPFLFTVFTPRPAGAGGPISQGPYKTVPDDALCTFYDASLNTSCRALLSKDGPQEDSAAFMEWTLARNGSPLTVSPEDDLARSTPDPEPSPPSPRGADHQPEPADDGEPFPAAINEPAQSRATERKIALEVEPNTSDQVRELVTVSTTREQAMDV